MEREEAEAILVPAPASKKGANLLFPEDPILCIVDVIVQRQDSVRFIVVHQTEHFFSPCGNDLQGDIGIKLPEMEKIPGQKRGAQGVCHGQTDISGGSFFFHAVFQFPGHPVDLMSVFQDFPAFFCEMDSMIDPFKELTVQFGFQLFDLKGDRRLGKSQTVCGFCEAAQFRHIDKGS